MAADTRTIAALDTLIGYETPDQLVVRERFDFGVVRRLSA